MAGEERGLAGRGSPIVGSETAACEELGSVCSVHWQSSSVRRCADGDGGREGGGSAGLALVGGGELGGFLGFHLRGKSGRVGFVPLAPSSTS